MKYKKYKAVAPLVTIDKIRKILFNNNMILKEVSSCSDTLYTCRTTLAREGIDQFNIGTNGKGRSYAFALASSHAEFMERLQNGIIYDLRHLKYATPEYVDMLPKDALFVEKIKKNDLMIDFLYDPKEEYWSLSKVMEEFGDELQLLLNMQSHDEVIKYCSKLIEGTKTIVIPFYSLSKKSSIMIPIELVLLTSGSNGMCAGNSDIECILQGICEIFERYAMSRIFFDNLTPPTVELELFRSTPVYEKIQYLKSVKGYDIVIKDCSLGIGLPVIGLIIMDRKTHQYNFKLGSDFVPHIALERCLTELYQSKNGFRGLPITKMRNITNFYDEFIKATIDGSGVWPKSIFSATASYSFDGFNESLGISDEADLHYTINLVNSLGFNLYLRNNSFLGFPTYNIIIPGMSQVSQAPIQADADDDSISILNKNKMISLLIKFWELEDENLKNLARALEVLSNREMKRNINDYFLFYTSKELIDLDYNLFLCMIYYKLLDFRKSKDFMDKFLADKKEDHIYYFAVSDYIQCKHIEQQTQEDAVSLLGAIYGKDMISDVVEDLEEPSTIFQYYNFPTCFNCEKCKMTQECHFFEILEVHKQIQAAHKKNSIDQEQCAKILLGTIV